MMGDTSPSPPNEDIPFPAFAYYFASPSSPSFTLPCFETAWVQINECEHSLFTSFTSIPYLPLEITLLTILRTPAMSNVNISDFQYPPRGFEYSSSACNATWLDILQAKNLDLSYPPNDPLQSQILFTAGMICRFSDNPEISDLAWHVYSTLTAFGCKSH